MIRSIAATVLVTALWLTPTWSLASAAAAAENQPVAVAAVPTVIESGVPVRLICHREEVTGTRFPGPRVCRTAQQWRDEALASAELARRMSQIRTTTNHQEPSGN